MSDYAEYVTQQAREGLAHERPGRESSWAYWGIGAALAGAFLFDWRAGVGLGILAVFERLAAIRLTMENYRHEAKLRGIMLDEAVNRLKSIQFGVNPESRKSL